MMECEVDMKTFKSLMDMRDKQTAEVNEKFLEMQQTTKSELGRLDALFNNVNFKVLNRLSGQDEKLNLCNSKLIDF